MIEQTTINEAHTATLEAAQSLADAIGKRGVAAVEAAAKAGPITARMARELVLKYRRKSLSAIAHGALLIGYYEDALDEFAKLCRQRRSEKKRLPLRSPNRAAKQPRAQCRSTAELAEILDAQRAFDVKYNVFSSYTHGDATVNWVENLNHTGITIRRFQDWDGYSKRRRFPMTVYKAEISAIKYLRVDLPGEARVIDGLITLGAEGVTSPDGVHRVWKATWLRKSRGVSWERCSGYIAQSPAGYIAHGATATNAIATLKRRATMAQRDALANRGIDRAEALRDHGNVRMRWAHARRAGLCADGIKSWAATHFPGRDPQRDSVTVREALATGSSEDLVLLAVARAIN